MWRQISPRNIFLSALALLLSSALATAWMVRRLYESQRRVQHTFQVQLTLDSVEKEVAKAGRSRNFFLSSGNSQFLRNFAAAREGALSNLARVKSLMIDNQEQLQRCNRLETVMLQRLNTSAESIQLAKSGIKNEATQSKLSSEIVEWATQGAAIIAEINKAEEILLTQRKALAEKLFRITVIVLVAAFLMAIFLIWEHYRVTTAPARSTNPADSASSFCRRKTKSAAASRESCTTVSGKASAPQRYSPTRISQIIQTMRSSPICPQSCPRV